MKELKLVEPKSPSKFEIELQNLTGTDSNNNKKDFDLIVNVLTKFYFIFGQQPFIDRCLHDPLLLFVNQMLFPQINNQENQDDIPFLLNGWSSFVTQWLKLGYPNRRQHIEQIKPDLLYDNDDD